jgi:hypothetical protein
MSPRLDPDRRPEELTVLGEQFAALERAERGRGYRPWPAVARPLAIAVLIALALVLASLTPPGRAVASRIGELIGVGDEPSEGPGIVIGAGSSPDGFPFEVVASDGGGPGISEGQTCVFLAIPGTTGRTGSCLTDDGARSLRRHEIKPLVYGAPPELGPEAELIVQGLTTREIDAVEVTYPDPEDGQLTSAPVQFSRLDARLGERIGSGERVGHFAAFLPQGVLRGDQRAPDHLTPRSIRESLSEVDVRALSDDGAVVTEGTLVELEPGDFSLLLIPPGRFSIAAREGAAARKRCVDQVIEPIRERRGGGVISFGSNGPIGRRIDRCVARQLPPGLPTLGPGGLPPALPGRSGP